MAEKRSPEALSRWEKMPLQTRRLMYWIFLVGLSLVVIVVWLSIVKSSIARKSVSNPGNDQKVQELQDNLRSILDQSSTELQKIKQELNLVAGNQATTTATSTVASSTPGQL